MARTSSVSRAESAWRTRPRPVGTRKKTLHRSAPSSATSRQIPGSSSTVSRLTVVFTWSRRPADRADLHAARVQANDPATCRKPSWTLALEPSSEKETVRTPAARSAERRPLVARGVPAGETAAASPARDACRTRAARSGRWSGSPPVKTTTGRGGPSCARSSRTARDRLRPAVEAGKVARARQLEQDEERTDLHVEAEAPHPPDRGEVRPFHRLAGRSRARLLRCPADPRRVRRCGHRRSPVARQLIVRDVYYLTYSCEHYTKAAGAAPPPIGPERNSGSRPR